MVASTDFDDAIRQARKRLDAFERSTSSGDLVTRLRASSPLHPFLVLRALALVATLGMLILTITALVIPFVYNDAAEIVAQLDDATGVPLFVVMAVLVLCFFGVAVGAHFAALVSARAAPFLPHEAKAHQRLVAELQQLEAQRAVQRRMTPMSAGPRIHAR
jgi:hypothetical protein